VALPGRLFTRSRTGYPGSDKWQSGFHPHGLDFLTVPKDVALRQRNSEWRLSGAPPDQVMTFNRGNRDKLLSPGGFCVQSQYTYKELVIDGSSPFSTTYHHVGSNEGVRRHSVVTDIGLVGRGCLIPKQRASSSTMQIGHQRPSAGSNTEAMLVGSVTGDLT